MHNVYFIIQNLAYSPNLLYFRVRPFHLSVILLIHFILIPIKRWDLPTLPLKPYFLRLLSDRTLHVWIPGIYTISISTTIGLKSW